MDQFYNVPNSSIQALTELLALPPSLGVSRPSHRWLRRQEDKVALLPRDVQRPTKLLDRLKITLGTRLHVPGLQDYALLCKAHRMLHPLLVRQLFNLLAAEVTIRSDRLRDYRPSRTGIYSSRGLSTSPAPTDPGNQEEAAAVAVAVAKSQASSSLSDTERIRDALECLDAVNALWIAEPSWKILFPGRELPEGFRRVASQCEACIVASVGARAAVLAALRANMLGRLMHSSQSAPHHRDPRLLRVVDSWIGCFLDADADEIRAESEDLGALFSRCREEMYEEKMARRNERKSRRHSMRASVLIDGARREVGAREAGDGTVRSGGSSSSIPPRRAGSNNKRHSAAPTMTTSSDERRQTELGNKRLEVKDQVIRDYEDMIKSLREQNMLNGHEDDEDGGRRRGSSSQPDADSDGRPPVEDDVQSWYARSQIDLSEAGGMHPAFQSSTYTHPSAAPAPLAAKRRTQHGGSGGSGKSSAGRSAALTSSNRSHRNKRHNEEDDESWVSATVHTWDPVQAHEQAAEPMPTQRPSPGPATRGRGNAAGDGVMASSPASRFAGLSNEMMPSSSLTPSSSSSSRRPQQQQRPERTIRDPSGNEYPAVHAETGRVFSGRFSGRLPDGSYIPIYAASSVYLNESNLAALDEQGQGQGQEGSGGPRWNGSQARTPKKDYTFHDDDTDIDASLYRDVEVHSEKDDDHDDDHDGGDGDSVLGMRGKFRDPFKEDRQKQAKKDRRKSVRPAPSVTSSKFSPRGGYYPR